MTREMEILLQRIDAGREYRDIVLPFEIRAGEGDVQSTIVEGYATTFDDEYLLYDGTYYRVYESVDRAAFNGCDMSDVIMQYDHMGRVFAATRNSTLSIESDQHGLKTVADLGGTTLGRQVLEEIRGGYSNKMSMGFRVKLNEIVEEHDHVSGITTVHRKITAMQKLYDVSVVSRPANPATEISARSWSEGVIARLAEERRRNELKRKILMTRLEIMKG